MKVYIKFLFADDANAVLTTPIPPGVIDQPDRCGRCGDTLYIPVDLPDDIRIEEPIGEVIRPRPKDAPFISTRLEPPSLPTLAISRPMTKAQQDFAKTVSSVVYVDNNGFAMHIQGYSLEPVDHICEDLIERGVKPEDRHLY